MRLCKKDILNNLEYIPFRALIAILQLIPYKYSKAFIAALFIGIGYRIGIRKDVAMRQLHKVYPDWDGKKIRTVLKEMYRQMGLNTAEIYLMNDTSLNTLSSIDGKKHVDEALAMGKGAILATAHFGNWEAARILPLKGIPVSVITKRQRNILFDSYTNDVRERNGVRTLDMKRGLRDVVRDLRENRMLAILADQNARSAGLIMDFLGFPASYWKGVAKLSLRYKVPIVPGFVVRKPDDSLCFEFCKMIYYPALEDVEENYAKILGEVARVTEEYIHRYPEQWFWVHKRWKHGYDMFADLD